MAKQVVGTVIVENDASDEVVTLYRDEINLYIEYGETKLVFDVREFLSAVIDILLEEDG